MRVGLPAFGWRPAASFAPSHLKRLQKRVEVDENDLGDVVFPRIHEEQHVRDAQQRQQNQCCFHSFSVKTGIRALSQYHTGNTHTHTPETHTQLLLDIVLALELIRF